jgi:hypothetical protein
MQDRRFLSLLGSLAALVAALNLSWATAASLVFSVHVSADSPFSSCAVGGSGTVYGNAETEPSIAVNPTSASNIVGVWQQDRWSSGGSRGAVASYSFDGGESWQEAALPFTSCVQGGLTYARASDVWVSFGPDGTAYAAAIALGQSGGSGVVAATSSDGGKRWTNAMEIIADGGNPRQFFDDKSSVTADPTSPGVAYAVWDRVESGGGEPDAGSRSGAPRASAYFAETVNGGKSWSSPRVITSADAGEALGNQIVVDRRTGVLYDFFDLINQPAGGRLSYSVDFVKSADGGATWSQPKTVAVMQAAPVLVPGSRESIRAGGIIPEAAIDPNSGKLYVVWMDSRFASGRYPEVAISGSADGGQSWSAPVRVNVPTGGPAFTPAVSVDATGTAAVTYYDFRSRTTETSVLPTDYWITFSTDGGASFGGEIQLDGPFDILAAPDSGGHFLGDYQSLTATGDSFISLFVRANSGDKADPTDVYAAGVSPAETTSAAR